MTDNVLSTPQRETSGAQTFGKYEYQYHWAICKIIEKHKKRDDYALLVEYHEDVVISDSLDGSSAQFSLYQVKNSTGAKYNANNLTSRGRSNTDKPKNSILGKLLSSCVNNVYSERINEIGLVASQGFSLSQEDPKQKFDIINLSDLSTECLKQLQEAMKSELGIESIPENLKFILPVLQVSNQQSSVIGEIAELVEELLPKSQTNPVSIYRSLIDELHRKGSIGVDFKDWERLIEVKSVTSHSVQKLISTNTSSDTIKDLVDGFDDISKIMEWRIFQSRTLKRNFQELCIQRAGMLTALDLKRLDSINRSLDSLEPDRFVSDKDYINAALELVRNEPSLPDLHNENEIVVETIYSLLKR